MNRLMAGLAVGIVLGSTPAMATRMIADAEMGSFLDQDLTSDSFSLIRAGTGDFAGESSVFDGSAAPTVSGGGRAQLDVRSSAGPKGTEGYIASFAETPGSLENALTDPNNGVSLEYSRSMSANDVNAAPAGTRDYAIAFVQNRISLGVGRIVGVTEAPEPAPVQVLALGLGLTVVTFVRKRRYSAR